jgi:sugar (pentulose or hexulose) kinase
MERESNERYADSSSARYILAIDLGSGGPKAAIVADDGEVLASAAEKVDTNLLPGGGALSDLWAQIHADVLGVSIHQVDDPLNTTVRGAAFLALVTLGYRSIEELPGLIKIRKVFEPDDSHRAIYDKMYKQYRELFKRNKKVFAALNA